MMLAETAVFGADPVGDIAIRPQRVIDANVVVGCQYVRDAQVDFSVMLGFVFGVLQMVRVGVFHFGIVANVRKVVGEDDVAIQFGMVFEDTLFFI